MLGSLLRSDLQLQSCNVLSTVCCESCPSRKLSRSQSNPNLEIFTHPPDAHCLVNVSLAITPKALQSIASADMDLNQLEAFLTAQTKKQGGITSDQAAVIAKFWKNHRVKIHESLVNQSCWDNVLKNMNWRVDLKSQSRHVDQINTPVAIVEMELGKYGQESEFLCLEFDEAKVSQMLKKLTEIEESMTALTQTT